MNEPLAALNLLLQRASAERDLALRALRLAQGNADAAVQQAEQLDQYRQDYRSRWGGEFARSGTAQLLTCYQAFGQRLEQVIVMQQTQLGQAKVRVGNAQQAWAARELRVAVVSKLIERRERERQLQRRRSEQRDSDELAQRVAQSKSAA